MIVYVESNFVFSLSREGGEHCQILLGWAETGHIELRIPAFAVPETRQALHRREKSRLEAGQTLSQQREDAKRHSAADAPTFDAAQQALRLWTDREAEQINSLLRRLLYGHVTFIPLDRDALIEEDVLRVVKVLSGDGDLLIFACVMSDLVARRNAGDMTDSLFVSGDADFLSTNPTSVHSPATSSPPTPPPWRG